MCQTIESEVNEQFINEIKPMWDAYLSKNFLNPKEIESKNKIDQSWIYYKNKIKNDDFTLDDFTNRADLVKDKKEYGYYLCSFLENLSSKIYGVSRPGNANQFGIKLNDDKPPTYYINTQIKEEKADRAKAEQIYNDTIKSFLSELINIEEIADFLKKIESYDEIIKSQQVLRKMAVLNFKDQMLSIYKDNVIDDIYSKIFKNNLGLSNLEKNNSIAKILIEKFEINDRKDEKLIILSKFLWKLFNTKNIFDKNSKNTILYGSPGTGKTYSVIEALKFLTKNDKSRYRFIQFHPSYSYEDFIEGIKPKGINYGVVNLELCNGEFKSFCMQAMQKPDEDYFFIVDEINRANLSSVFGEILYCLEYRYNQKDSSEGISKGLIRTQYSSLIDSMPEDKREELSVYYDKTEKKSYFCIPDNIYFVGMMNDVDKSIDSFDLALRRRFKWIRYKCDYDVLEKHLLDKGYDEEIISNYIKCCKCLNEFISGSDNNSLNLGESYEFGHSFFMKITDINSKSITKKNLEALFEKYLRGTLKEYLRAYYSENEIEGEKGRLKKSLDIFQGSFKTKNDNN